jgi:hypothetical protein
MANPIDFTDLVDFSFAKQNEEKESEHHRGLSLSSVNSEIIEPDQFIDERELHRDVGEFKYGNITTEDGRNIYVIPPNSILNPTYLLKNLNVEKIPINEKQEKKILKEDEENEKEDEEYERKTGHKKLVKYVEKTITYLNINHYVYTKLLCRPEEQIKIRNLKWDHAIRVYFETVFNKCLSHYEIAERKEYEDVKGSVALRKNRINSKGELEVINIGIVNYVIEQYKIAVSFILDYIRTKYPEFVNELLKTGDTEIVYRNLIGLQYSKSNNGFSFEFNKRLDSSNVYGKLLQELREKIKYKIQYINENKEREDELVPFMKNEVIKNWISNKITITINNLKYFYNYLFGIAFPESGKYSEKKGKTIENLELRQDKRSNFYLTPEMLNYVIKEIMLSQGGDGKKVSIETTFKYEKFEIYISNKLNKAFPILKEDEKKKSLGKTTKSILIEKIWGYIFNSFMTLKRDSIEDTIDNIKYENEKLTESKCMTETKRIGKEGCVVEALTYILVTVMDWNEFTEIGKDEIILSCFILSDKFFNNDDNKKKLTKLYKENTKPSDKSLNLLIDQIQTYELEIGEKQLNYIGNVVDYIMTMKPSNSIWTDVMFYSHKF